MTKTSIKTSVGTIIQFNPNVPVHVKPSIQIERTDEDGERWYETACGRIFRADLFDKMYKVERTKIKPKGHREDLNYKRNN